MKYSCYIIQDLLPLYHDGVCSDQSKEIIEQHLSECPDCKDCYEQMCETDDINLPEDTNREIRKAASLRAVKKKLRIKQMVAAAASIVVLAAVAFAVMGILKKSADIVVYDDNISVSMTDGSLVGRLKGSRYNSLAVKRTSAMVDGQAQNYLFFCLSDTKWASLTTDDKLFSEYILCPSDKSADEINGVYYFTGDFTDIETMDNNELQEVIRSSVLLWSK